MDYIISIIMPCYKGESFIENSIKRVMEEVSFLGKDFELIVVIDGFIDEGYRKAKPLELRYENLKVFGYEKNRGKGYAIQYGLKQCQGKYIAYLDSDLDYHPKAIGWFLEIAEEKDADLVIGNRKDKKSTFRYPLIRRVASMVFSIYINFLFPKLEVHDTQAGIKLLNRNAAQKIFQFLEDKRTAEGFIFDIHLLVIARKLDLKILEAPCIFEMKSSTIGVGKHFIGSAFKMGREVWKLRQDLGL
jgi:glycosyltransferase involved in cell wall biosynthesis